MKNLLVFAFLVAGSVVAVQSQTGLPTRLLQQDDLAYQGAFLPPLVFDYGGTALTFNPARNSLFIVDRHQKVAEISIPEVRAARAVDTLARATFLQPLTDITEGRLANLNPGDPNGQLLGGLLRHNDTLIATGYSYYDGARTQRASHFRSGVNLALAGDVVGPVRVAAPHAGYVGGYLAHVPEVWRSAVGGPVINGQCCIPIISRTSYGPGLFAIDPADIGVKDVVPSVPLLYYTGVHQLNDTGVADPWSGSDGKGGPAVVSAWFNGATQVTGVVFPEGARSVLFFGRQGLGKMCYGTGGPDGFCRDMTDHDKGTHAYPYRYQVWAYDVLDLIAVKEGRKQPWEPKPYAVWELKLPISWGETGVMILNGAAYDPATGRIFVVQAGRESGGRPVIHVLNVRP